MFTFVLLFSSKTVPQTHSHKAIRAQVEKKVHMCKKKKRENKHFHAKEEHANVATLKDGHLQFAFEIYLI